MSLVVIFSFIVIKTPTSNIIVFSEKKIHKTCNSHEKLGKQHGSKGKLVGAGGFTTAAWKAEIRRFTGFKDRLDK
jgi:hypothetical protein